MPTPILQSPPQLPTGYQSQPAWSFRDRTGRLTYKFDRVYQKAETVDDERGPTCQIDEGRSFVGVTWSSPEDDRMTGRWLTFADARELRGPRMTFERFSSLRGMEEDLEKLLDVAAFLREAPADDKTKPSPVVVLVPAAVPL
jgi:hypothetical protein